MPKHWWMIEWKYPYERWGVARFTYNYVFRTRKEAEAFLKTMPFEYGEEARVRKCVFAKEGVKK